MPKSPSTGALSHDERLLEILRTVDREGRVRIQDLADRTHVTTVQIRKDIEQLRRLKSVRIEQRRGHIDLPPSTDWLEQSEFGLRVRQGGVQRELLGEVTASIIQQVVRPSAWLFFDAGSQMLQVSRALREVSNSWRAFPIQTNNLQIALELLEVGHPTIELHGGLLDRDLGALIRSDLINTGLDKNRPDAVCLSCHNVSARSTANQFEIAFHANNDAEVQTKRAITALAERYILMAFDHTKLMHRTGTTVFALDELLQGELGRPEIERRRVILIADVLADTGARSADHAIHLAFEQMMAEHLAADPSFGTVCSFVVLGRQDDAVESSRVSHDLDGGYQVRCYPEASFELNLENIIRSNREG